MPSSTEAPLSHATAKPYPRHAPALKRIGTNRLATLDPGIERLSGLGVDCTGSVFVWRHTMSVEGPVPRAARHPHFACFGEGCPFGAPGTELLLRFWRFRSVGIRRERLLATARVDYLNAALPPTLHGADVRVKVQEPPRLPHSNLKTPSFGAHRTRCRRSDRGLGW